MGDVKKYTEKTEVKTEIKRDPFEPVKTEYEEKTVKTERTEVKDEDKDEVIIIETES